MADNTWTRLGQMMKSRLVRELFLSFWLRTYGCLSTYRRRYPGVFPFLQYASCFIKGRKIHRFWTWKSTGRPWSRPDLFKMETTSRQNSRCKVRQPAFLKISHQWMVRWFVQNAIIYTCWSSGTYITVNIDPNTKKHSVLTSMKKATTFFNDEYLKDTKACSDSHYFYFKCQCFHSYRKNDKPHDLRLAIYLITGEVKHAFCSCVAGRIGFCNHVLALMMKVSLFSFYEWKNTNDLDDDVS